jgi:adenylate cyclase
VKRGDKEKVVDSEKDGNLARPRLGRKSSEPVLSGTTVSPNISKRGSGSHNEYLHPRILDYASIEQITAAKKGPRGRGWKGGQEEQDSFQIDTDFSNLDEFVKRQGTPPDPSSSWLDDIGAQPNTAPTWEPPESWATQGVQHPSAEPSDVEDETESGPEDAQYCIRVFRADSTFATLSCKLQSSVTEVLGLLGRKSFLQDNLANYQIVMRKNGLLRILGPNERPLKIQKRLLEQAGYTEGDHLDEIGREDHGYLVRFTFMMARTGGYSLVCYHPALPPIFLEL